MKPIASTDDNDEAVTRGRQAVERLFSRITAAHTTHRNSVQLLRDGAENYTRWIEAIASAESHVYFENYYVQEDRAGQRVADVLIDRARAGVRVYVLYDWLGNFRRASRRFWTRMREAGVEVRAYNAPDPLRPFTILARDHRKTLLVDNRVGFVSGLCVGDEWLGDPANGVVPWRDTGVEIRGTALADLEIAFARSWSVAGPPLAAWGEPPAPAGHTSVRIVASDPSTTGMLRLDEVIAGFATRRIWITDPYYNGVGSYEEALGAAAQDGVDVRLLAPGTTDLPWLRPFSRSGFRTLIEAGVRVFQWNGSMMHAKSAVVDGRWARVGSTNLNVASWLTNRELDAVIEDEEFGRQIEQMYLEDLENSTELVIDTDGALRAVDVTGCVVEPPVEETSRRRGKRGSGDRAKRSIEAARTLGDLTRATVKNQRDLSAREARVSLIFGGTLASVGVVTVVEPRPLAYLVAVFAIWFGVAFVAAGLRRISAGKTDSRETGRERGENPCDRTADSRPPRPH